MAKQFHFNIVISGEGDDKDEAWDEAVDFFVSDPGNAPSDDEIEVEEIIEI